MKVNAYLEITMKISEENRPAAAKVYMDYRQPFLDTINGALTKIFSFVTKMYRYSTALILQRMHRLIFQANFLKMMFCRFKTVSGMPTRK